MQELNQRPKGKVPVVGTASLNLAEFASAVDQKDFDLNVPLILAGGSVEPSLTLSVCTCSIFKSLFYLFVLHDIYCWPCLDVGWF